MNTSIVAEPRTAAALAARRSSTQTALGRVHDAISRLRREKAPISVAAVGRRAGVSRTFLYSNTEARSAVAAAVADADERRGQALADFDDQHEATWRERALNARTPSRPPTPRYSPSAPASAHSSARSATCEPNGPRKPSSESPRRTPPSSNASASSPPTIGPWGNA